MPTTLPQTEILTPDSRRLAYIGGATVACGISWLAAIGTAGADIPHEMFLVLLGSACVLSIVAVILGVAYINQKACAHNQESILIAIGAMAAEQEQHGQKLAKIDPWTIYTAVYEDLLKDRN